VTYRLLSLSDQPLPVYFFINGVEQQFLLPPRKASDLEADELSPATNGLIRSKQIRVVSGTTFQPVDNLTQQAFGKSLVWAGNWSTGTRYPVGFVVAFGGFTWVSLEDHSGVTVPSVGNPYWDVYSILSTNVLFGVDITTMTNGQLIARDDTVTGGFKATLINDAQVNEIGMAKITGLTTALGAKLPLAGGTLTGPLILAANPSTALGAATKQYADLMLPKAGGTMTGFIRLHADPVNDLDAATKVYVDNKLGTGFVAKSGDTMSGLLTLSGAPVNALHAATKAYADLRLPLAGGTMTGDIVLAGAPSAPLHPATKAYADTKLSLTGGTLTGPLGVVAPTAVNHAASKSYVDSQVSASRTFTGKVSVPIGTIPTNPGDLVPLAYLTASGLDALQRAGGTMTGPIVLSGAPTIGLHPATKTYADAIRTDSLPKAGGVMTGAITGTHGLLPVAAGAANPLTGELSLLTIPDLAAAAKTGLAYSPERGSVVYAGKTVCIIGTERRPNADYTVLPGDGRIYANSGSTAVLLRFGDPNTYPALPVTVRKVGASPNAPVYLVLPGLDGRSSFYVLSQNQETITLLPDGGVWSVIGRSAPSLSTFTVELNAVTTVGSDKAVEFDILDYYSHSSGFSAISDEGGGLIGFDTGSADEAGLWSPGDQFIVSGTASGYVDDYVVDSIDGNLVLAAHAFTSTDAGQMNGVVRPSLGGKTRTAGIIVTASPSDPWTMVSDLDISVVKGDEVHPGGDAFKIVRSTTGGRMKVLLTNSGGARTVYIHVLSAGELHGHVNGGYDSIAVDTTLYATNVTGAAASSGNTVFTVPHTSGYNVGDIVDVTGTSLYDGARTVVSKTSGTITLNVTYTATATTGTITSRNAVALQVLDPDGFDIGQYVGIEGIASLGGDRVARLLVGTVPADNLLIARSTYNPALSRNGFVGVLPVVPVTFA